MTFKDLPPNVRTTPMSESHLRADLIDLLVGERDRSLGCVGLWYCDEDLVAQQPVLISHAGHVAAPDARFILDTLLQVAIGPVFVGLGRPGASRFTSDDVAFAAEVEGACARAGVACLGIYIASTDAVREIPEALRQAS
ncbi:MAG: hypothetical protein IPM00_12515 [Tetrasphaera sp.]|nr:hypothetical protein [Tetrasphaera sp.]